MEAALNALGALGWDMISIRAHSTKEIIEGNQCTFFYEAFMKLERS
jgi:hypothetical protein